VIYYANTILEHCSFIYLLLYNMFRQFCSDIIRLKHKYIIRSVCYVKGHYFIICMIQYKI